jgi:PAT family beta-lactamase induction signal transducer AmpG
LWFLGIWQSLSNLTYAWVAITPETGNWGVYAASGAESFCGGLGTAAFLAFLMSICNKHYSATQYAILSALFRITGIVAGSLSGWATRSMGFGPYFALTFLLSLPAFLLLFYVRTWIPADPNGNSEAPALGRDPSVRMIMERIENCAEQQHLKRSAGVDGRV